MGVFNGQLNDSTKNTLMKNLAVTVENSLYSATFRFVSNISQKLSQTQ